MIPFRRERLANGVDVAFIDLSNRYFGDYHRVCIEVQIAAPGPSGSHGTTAGQQRLATVKRLERMAVAGAEVATVRQRLVDDFWRHAGRYLAHPDFPARLATRSALPGRSRVGSHDL